jgi:hypothetical protein
MTWDLSWFVTFAFVRNVLAVIGGLCVLCAVLCAAWVMWVTRGVPPNQFSDERWTR